MNNITKDIEPLFIATNNDESFSGDTEIVEAFRIVGRPIFATQYHPEELYDAFSNKVIGSLLANKQK
jgi:anthranilate/para-aminobenzoate synthase component II